MPLPNSPDGHSWDRSLSLAAGFTTCGAQAVQYKAPTSAWLLFSALGPARHCSTENVQAALMELVTGMTLCLDGLSEEATLQVNQAAHLIRLRPGHRDAEASSGAGPAAGGAGGGDDRRRCQRRARQAADTVGLITLVGTQLGQMLVSGRSDPLTLLTGVGSLGGLVATVQIPGLSQAFGCRPLGPLGLLQAGAATALGTGMGVVLPWLDGWLGPPEVDSPPDRGGG